MVGVEVRNLSLCRGTRMLLNDVSFSLPSGSISVLSGRSGCGKSTLLLALQGLLDKHEATITGEIVVDGCTVRQMEDDIPFRSASGFLMQNVDAQIVNTVSSDEIVFGMENRGMEPQEMRERFLRIVEQYGIDPDKPTKSLSGGQKQRLLLASILVTGHRVVFLDEPFANLDSASVILLREVLEQLKEEGATILIVEHRLEITSGFADALLWMEDGLLREYNKEDAKVFAAHKAKILTANLDWPSPTEHNALRACNLSAMRGRTSVLQGLDVSLTAGSTTLLLGQNGCGKTTLLRFLCGLSRYSEFSVDVLTYFSDDVKGRRGYGSLKKKVGFVFQNPAHQLFMKTVQEELLLRCGDRSWAECVMELFGIEHLAQRHPYTLSQGEKRRVSVAAIVASRAPLILLDEPTIGQDYENLRGMAEALCQVQIEQGTTFLISTHDAQAVELFGSRSISLD